MAAFPFRLLPLFATHIVVIVGSIANAQTPLAKDSPFLPPTNATSINQPSGETHELAGVSTTGKQTSVVIFDKQAKKGRWIPVGETVDGITVLNFDSPREQALVRIGGVDKLLKLRKPSGGSGGGVTPAGNSPNKLTYSRGENGNWTVSGISNSQPVGTPSVASSAPPTTTPIPQQPPPPPIGSEAHQAQEARMLVSDLLEIGMAQRKAYEDAQKKANPAASNTPADPAATAPAAMPTAPQAK